MNKKIVTISNSLILGVSTLTISFVWFRWILRDSITALTLAIILSSILDFFFVRHSIMTNRVTKGTKDMEQKYLSFKSYLTYSTSNEIFELLKNTFKDYITNNNTNFLTITIDNMSYNVYNLTNKPVLCKDDIIRLKKENFLDCMVPTVIVVIDIESDATNELNNLYPKCEIIDSKILFDLCSTYNTLPKCNVKNKEKFKVKDLFRASFSPKNFKGYLYASIIVGLSSLFVTIKIYYLIWASILLLCAILSHYDIFKSKVNTKSNFVDTILDKK